MRLQKIESQISTDVTSRKRLEQQKLSLQKNIARSKVRWEMRIKAFQTRLHRKICLLDELVLWREENRILEAEIKRNEQAIRALLWLIVSILVFFALLLASYFGGILVI